MGSVLVDSGAAFASLNTHAEPLIQMAPLALKWGIVLPPILGVRSLRPSEASKLGHIRVLVI